MAKRQVQQKDLIKGCKERKEDLKIYSLLFTHYILNRVH